MSHWHETCPTHPPMDPLPHGRDAPPREAEWWRCRFCGIWFSRRVGARAEYCPAEQCAASAQRVEYRETMTTEEHNAYSRAAEAYFSRPEEPAGGQKPLKAGRGLSGFSARQADTLAWKRQQDNADDEFARERGW